jgi:LacI family transcriptional regulator
MGYFPNILARSLRNIHSNTIGLVIPDIRNPFFADVAKGVEAAARKTGYHVFLCNTGNDEEEERIAINLCKVIT